MFETLAIHWNADPVLLSLGSLEIRWYSLLFISGFILGWFIFKWFFQREGVPVTLLDPLLYTLLIGTIVGARLGHCIFYEPEYYFNHILEMFLPMKETADGWKFIGYAGLASHGATVGIITSLWLYARKYKFSLWDLWDKIALVSPLGGGFIRLGNFFNSEIIGAPTEMPWGVTFSKVDMLPRHPAQLYEAIGYFIIFAIAYYVYTRKL